MTERHRLVSSNGKIGKMVDRGSWVGKRLTIILLFATASCGRMDSPTPTMTVLTPVPPVGINVSPTDTITSSPTPSPTETPVPTTAFSPRPSISYPLEPGPVINKENAERLVLLGSIDVKTSSWRNGRQLDWSPDSLEIAVASDGNGIRFIDPLSMAETGAITAVNDEPVEVPGIVSYSPDGKTLAAAIPAGFQKAPVEIWYWDPMTHSPVGDRQKIGADIFAIEYSHNGGWMAIGSMNQVLIKDPGKDQFIWSYDEEHTQFDFALFSWDDKHFAFTGWGLSVMIVSTVSWKPEKVFGNYMHQKACFSPNGDYVSFEPGIWSARDWTLIGTLGEEYTVDECDFGKNSDVLIKLEESTEIQIWDVDARELLLKILNPQKGFNDLALSPDGRFIAVADDTDNTIKIWGIPAE
jgi:WD40 repeat protein